MVVPQCVVVPQEKLYVECFFADDRLVQGWKNRRKTVSYQKSYLKYGFILTDDSHTTLIGIEC